MEKLSKPKEIRKLREAFRLAYSNFARDFNELGERFRKVSIDAEMMLDAMEKIVK